MSTEDMVSKAQDARLFVANELFDVLREKWSDMDLEVRKPVFELERDAALRETEFIFIVSVTERSIRKAFNGR